MRMGPWQLLQSLDPACSLPQRLLMLLLPHLATLIMAASIIGQFKMWFHLQPRAFYEICHCYHRQCGEERSLHLLRSCLAGCVRCLSEVCHHLQCLDGCSLSETLHLKRESIGLWQCFHRRCGHGHPCVQRLAECDQLPQVCSSLLPCQDYWSPQWIWEFYSLVQDVLQL